MADDPTGTNLDAEGIPDLEGPLPEKVATGDAQDGVAPPSTRPAAFDWGITAAEQRAGEPISVRVARELPDVGDVAPYDGPRESGFVLVDGADEDVDRIDDEKDAVGRAVDDGGQMRSPEEAALHVVDDPDQALAADPDAYGPDPDGLGPLDDGYGADALGS